MARKPFDPAELVATGSYPGSFGGRAGAPRLLALVYEESRKYYAQFDD